MDYSSKTDYQDHSNYDSGKIKYKSKSLCETGCTYCTGCASAKPGGTNYV